jgi:hypothetical protein
MKFSSLVSTTIEAVVTSVLILGMLVVGEAQVRTSPNYRLESDSVNFAGGLSSSSNYSLESTAGEVSTGPSASTNYQLRAGYQQMQEVFISMTAPGNIVMTPSIGGITGGVANGSTSVIVVTDSPSGYALSLSAETAPAMNSETDSIADYVPLASPNPDLVFNTSSTQAHFGFSPQGTDVVLRYLNNTSVCNAGTLSVSLQCWDGVGTSTKLVAEGSSNQPSGVTTNFNFRVELGGGISVPEGEYVATTTLTALPI